MRILLLAVSALALSVGTSGFAQGNGNRGGGGGGGKPERVHQGGGHGGGQQAERGNRGRGGGQQAERRGGGGPERADRGNGQQRQAERAAQRGPDREMRGNDRDRDVVQRGPDGRGRGVENRRVEREEQRQERAERRMNRRAMRVEDPRDLARLSWEPERGVGRGCPPGLAKKNNGCMPPGQAKQMADSQNWFRGWFTQPQSTSFLYDDGYLVRLNDGGSIEGFIPLLGGALWPGQAWPEGFQASPVADYHLDYFGLADNYDYRFADGAIYAVDPTTQLIQQVVALVAGDQFAVGQRLPDGYGVYNVPYEFRDQYQDTPEALYRYSDGYVYQVDPTTQLIQAAIQLIT